MAMLKSDLVQVVADRTGLTKKAAGQAIDAVLEAVVEALKSGDEVLLTGFGKFYVSHVAEKQGINPQTLAPLTIPAHNSPKFKAGKALKDAVR